MKRFTTILTLMMTALLSFTFTSCDKDAEVAYYMDGTWKGNIYVSSNYNGQVYKAAYSEIEFDSGYSSGDGYWIDYYSNSPYDYIANHITWAVRNQNIYIHFEEENSDVVIYNFDIDDNMFSGYIQTSDGTKAAFTLYHTSSPNWNNYRFGYDNYSYAKTRSNTTVAAPKRLFIK
jgi:hypothetical protein